MSFPCSVRCSTWHERPLARRDPFLERLLVGVNAAVVLATAGVEVARAQVTQCVSVTQGSAPVPGEGLITGWGNLISDDGRFVLFYGSSALAGATPPTGLPLVRDRLLGVTEGVSFDLSGVLKGAGGDSAISTNGRYIAFVTSFPNMVAGHVNGWADVFLRDRLTVTTEVISVSTTGAASDYHCHNPYVSADGRFVSFETPASTLVPGDTNGAYDIFLRDRLLGTTERVSVSSAGVEGNDHSWASVVSADGRYVAFNSLATNLVVGDTNGRQDVFVRDRLLGRTRRVSVASDESQADADSYLGGISGDGAHVSFESSATNLAAGFGGGFDQAYVRNVATGTTDLVSVAMDGSPGNGSCWMHGLSSDGRFALFSSYATNLTSSASPNAYEQYVRDMQSGQTAAASTATSGAFGNAVSYYASISANGRYVVFESSASDLVPGDTNGADDIFIKDRFATGFASLCEPGQGNVIDCPCGNPPGGPGRGCDNSLFNGGATLLANGNAYVSQDSLVFTTAFEKPNATSILLQGTTLLLSGVVFGQGVRCAGGPLKRLYVKAASGGMISAPDLAGGDPPVSTRLALLGAPIDCGLPHLYLVYYRDPVVLGGCPATSTFNATQTGSIQWWP